MQTETANVCYNEPISILGHTFKYNDCSYSYHGAYIYIDGTIAYFDAIPKTINFSWGSVTLNDCMTCTGGYRGVSITVSACTPNWQCEQPLNGYEFDGCGNRRTNPLCDACSDVNIVLTIGS